MASGSAEDDRWRRGGRLCQAELEEGEFDPAGCQSETDTDEYYNRHSPSESDETVSDCDRETSCGVVPADGGGGGASASSFFAQGWGVTGKRGCSGSVPSAAVAVSPSAEPVQSTANVPAEPTVVLQPMPLAFATPNLPSMAATSARANLSGQSSSSAPPAHDDAMEIALAGAARAINPPTEAIIHQQPIAPQPQPARQPQHVHQQPLVAPPPAGAVGRQDPNGYTCKKCGMWFRNHQGLGGHMVGHKNRELAATAAGVLPEDGGAATAGRRNRNPRPERPHVCDECGAEFRTGVQLGGHKRKHWTGPPIVPKKKPRVVAVVQPLPPAAEDVANLTLALPSVEADEAPPAVEAARPAVERTPEPAPRAPAAPGRVLLFGIDIGAGAQTPETPQQGSPATESSASTSGQQYLLTVNF